MSERMLEALLELEAINYELGFTDAQKRPPFPPNLAKRDKLRKVIQDFINTPNPKDGQE